MIASCPKCKMKIDVAERDLGRSMRCPACEFPFKPAPDETEDVEAIAVVDAPPAEKKKKKAANKAYMDDVDRKLAEEKAWTRRNRERGLYDSVMSIAAVIGLAVGLALGVGLSIILWSRGMILGPLSWVIIIFIGSSVGTGLGAVCSKFVISVERSSEAAKQPRKKKR